MAIVDEYGPSETYDMVSEVVKGKAVNFSHANMLIKDRRGDVIAPYYHLVGRYHHALNKYIVEYTFSKEEFQKYYQRPKLFCIEQYGTPELWSSLLYINNMVSVVNFTKQTIKIFTQNIDEAINELITIYQPDIEMNKTKVYHEDWEE